MRLVLDVGKKYLEITGDLSDAFVSDLKKAERRTDYTELILDFEGVKAVNSMALGALFIAHRRLREQNRDLQLINVSENLARILRMVDLEETLLQPAMT